ncbi:MAG: hypothetical protein R2729_27720 [Bryobacteraceae bacterium]
MSALRSILALMLAAALPHAAAQTAILQLQILEGEGAVHAAGGKALRPITVQVTDETGKPVNGAAVSFRLPEEGVTGTFANGLKTSLLLTGPDGRVTEWSIRWGSATGPTRVRVTAAKDLARAGAMVGQYVAETAPSQTEPPPIATAKSTSPPAPQPAITPEPTVSPRVVTPSQPLTSGITIFETPKGQGPGMSRGWWLMLATGAAGAAAYFLLKNKGTNQTPGGLPGGGSSGAVTTPGGIQFGNPVISVGRP